MRFAEAAGAALLGGLAGLTLLGGCSPDNGVPFAPGMPSGGTGGAAAGGPPAGTDAAPAGTDDAAVLGPTDAAPPGTGGAGGSAIDAGLSGSGGMGGTGGMVAVGGDILKIVPTAGCGPVARSGGRATIMTTGTKPQDAADSQKGDWAYEREYFVFLPAAYDPSRPYPLVLQGSGCGATGTNVPNILNNVEGAVIRVGVTPPPNDIGHATNPSQGCFDDHEGDDSVDWVFYENLYDKLAAEFCFDRNRVFASGLSSGAWFANELACKYAGDAFRPVRGVLSNEGSLPTEAPFAVTCSGRPLAGMWLYEARQIRASGGNSIPIDRAMRANGCSEATFASAQMDDYPIGGGLPPNVCKKIRGCPELYPLVACVLPGEGKGSHDNVANPGFATFIKLLSKAPFLVQ